MLGLGGFGGQGVYGMGIELGFRYPGRAGIKGARNDFRQLSREAMAADRKLATSMRSMRRGFNMVMGGTALVGASIGLSALHAKTEQAFADIESLGASHEVIDKLAKSFHKLMMNEDLPIDLRKAEGAMYDMVSAGIRFKDVNTVLKQAAYLAKGTLGDISDAAKIMGISYEKVFDKMAGTTEDKAKRIADIFAATVRTYRTKLPGLASEFAEIAGDIPSNWKMENVIPLIGTLYGRYEGMTGARLRSIISHLPTAQEKLGLNFADETGQAKDPLEIIRLLKGKFGDTIDLKEKQLLVKAFGQEVVGAVVSMMELENRYIEGRYAAKQFGFAEEMARKRTNTLSGQTDILKTKLGLLGDTIGEGGFDLKKYVKNINEAIKNFDKFLNLNPEISKTFITSLSAMGIFLGGAGVIKIFTGAAGIWGTAAASVFGESLAAAIGSVAFPVAAIGTALYLAYLGANKIALNKLNYTSWGAAEVASKQKVTGIINPKQSSRVFDESGKVVSKTPDFSFRVKTGMTREEIEAAGGTVLPSEVQAKTTGKQQVTHIHKNNVSIKPTLVVQGDDPNLRDKIKKFYAEAMQEARWQYMRRGGSPAEVSP